MRALAIAVFAACIALAVVAAILAWLNRATPTPQEMSIGSKGLDVAFPIAFLASSAPGALIALRLPRHPVAWCFLIGGLSGELFLSFLNYAVYGTLTAPGRLPGAELAIWTARWFWPIPPGTLLLAMLLFPSGRPPSWRWWPVAWLTIATVLVMAAVDALRLSATLPWLVYFASLIGAAVVVGVAESLFVRFGRSRGVERQQLKWVVYAATLMLGASLLASLQALPVAAAGTSSSLALIAGFGSIVGMIWSLSVVLIGIAAAMAILRYRLYDIDVVIERTLVYGVVSAALGATYVVAVVVLQGVLRPVTGGSQIAVALSTLLVVALFSPIRSRAQDVVDRRFYRARYDAARTIDAFSVRLRGDVDLDSVRADLIGVVHDTICPAHATLWLRGPSR